MTQGTGLHFHDIRVIQGPQRLDALLSHAKQIRRGDDSAPNADMIGRAVRSHLRTLVGRDGFVGDLQPGLWRRKRVFDFVAVVGAVHRPVDHALAGQTAVIMLIRRGRDDDVAGAQSRTDAGAGATHHHQPRFELRNEQRGRHSGKGLADAGDGNDDVLTREFSLVVWNSPQVILCRMPHGVGENRDLLRDGAEDHDGVGWLVMQRGGRRLARLRCRGQCQQESSDDSFQGRLDVRLVSGGNLAPDMFARRDRRVAVGFVGSDATRNRLDCHLRIGVDEQRNRIAIAGPPHRPHAMQGGTKAAVGPTLHQIARVDHDRVRDGNGGPPLTIDTAHLQTADIVLEEQRNRAIVRVRSGAELRVAAGGQRRSCGATAARLRMVKDSLRSGMLAGSRRSTSIPW